MPFAAPQFASPSSRLLQPKYRPDIDGLRAVAVLPVVLFHAFPGLLPGGFIGVDIFFVISGFLITTIILGSFEGQGFSYRVFYARRIRRIFPALALVMAATLAAGWLWLFPDEWRRLGLHLASGAGFASNFVFWGEAGYFDTASHTKVLLHLWSLAIEEQFYIAWPLLLGLLWWRKWPVLPVLAAIALASLAVNIALVMTGHSSAAFYAPWTRAWELMAGGMLACLRLHTFKEPLDESARAGAPGFGMGCEAQSAAIPAGIASICNDAGRPNAGCASRDGFVQSFLQPWLPWPPALRAHVQSVAGIALIALGLVLIHNDNTFPGWWALLPVLGAALCLAAGPDGLLNRRLLAWRPLVWVGAISYPLYLWHWPLLVFARLMLNDDAPSRTVRIGVVIAAFVLAWLTYRFIERPVRRQRGTRPVLGLCLIVVVLGLSGLLAGLQAWKTYHTDNSPPRMEYWVNWPGALVPVPVDAATGLDVYRAGSGPRKVLLIGDSQLMMLAPRLQTLLARDPSLPVTLDFSAALECPPIAGVQDDLGHVIKPTCNQRRDVLFNRANNGGYDAIALAACWSCYLLLPQYAGHHHFYSAGEHRILLNTPEGQDAALRQLGEQISAWTRQHKKVYLVLNIPGGPPFDPVNAIKGARWDWAHMHSSPVVPLTAEQTDLYVRMREMARRSGAQVLDPIPDLCRDGQCQRTLPDGTPIYSDGYHLGASYVRQHATWMDALVAP